MRFRPAGRLKWLKKGGMSRMVDLARGLPDIISLSIGEPDVPVDSRALEAGCGALHKGKTHYEPTKGLPELRRALAEKTKRAFRCELRP